MVIDSKVGKSPQVRKLKSAEKWNLKFADQSTSLIYGSWFNSQVIAKAHGLGRVGRKNWLSVRVDYEAHLRSINGTTDRRWVFVEGI